MPDSHCPLPYAYNGTLTFDSDHSLEFKNKYIDKFPKLLSRHLLHNPDNEYYLVVCKEYHKVSFSKVDVRDDFEAPHLHYILYSRKKIGPLRKRALLKFLKDSAGLMQQFYLMTKLKTEQWIDYIHKDCELNYKRSGKSHQYELYLEPEFDELDPSIFVKYKAEEDELEQLYYLYETSDSEITPDLWANDF
jgi:hypothetical protein